ncbi:MAG: LytTR family transcriptional regulator DNA-binding domain-containing protein [Bacteroidetes bacterium]|nr:LytTR family transcriptional regulator DNA-binding domain-containing protein [Bacteroidota bacterium]
MKHVHLAANGHSQQHIRTEGNPFNKIVLSTTTGYYFVNIADIIYCEAVESYTHIFTENDIKYTACHPLKEFDELFTAQNFFRIHKSYLINLNKVAVVNKDSIVVMKNQKELPVSFRKRKEFFDLLKDFSFL